MFKTNSWLNKWLNKTKLFLKMSSDESASKDIYVFLIAIRK